MNTRTLAIIGHAGVGYAASTLRAIEIATEKGMAIVHVNEDNPVDEGFHADVVIEDEMPRGIDIIRQEAKLQEMKLTRNSAMDFNLTKPMTRAERRAKRPRKRKRKF